MLNSISDVVDGVTSKFRQYCDTYCKPYYYTTFTLSALGYVVHTIAKDRLQQDHTQRELAILSFLKDVSSYVAVGSVCAFGIGVAKPQWVINVTEAIQKSYNYLNGKNYDVVAITVDAGELISDTVSDVSDDIHHFATGLMLETRDMYRSFFFDENSEAGGSRETQNTERDNIEFDFANHHQDGVMDMTGLVTPPYDGMVL